MIVSNFNHNHLVVFLVNPNLINFIIGIYSKMIIKGLGISKFYSRKNNDMKTNSSNAVSIFSMRLASPWIVAAILMSLVESCQKTGTAGPSGGGGATPLSKEVILGFDGSNNQLDSIVILSQYNGNKNLSQLQRTTLSRDSAAVFNSALTYNFTYAASLVSSISGSYTESVQYAGKMLNAATQINTSFTTSGGKIVSYVQVTTTTGSPIIPVTTETGNDSALFVYDANGNLSTYTIYQKEFSQKNYSLISKQSFTYSGGNLSQSVNAIFVEGIPVDTMTTTYQYNSKLSAAPLFIFPGVNISVINDLTQVTLTTAGVNPSVTTSTYQTTYNSNNQPVSSTVTVDTTPTPKSSVVLVKEEISYFY
jgi:hypothetical protein